VLGPAVNIVASLEVTEGLKLLLGKEEELHGQFIYVDAWTATLERLELGKRDTPCPACDLGQFEFLEAKAGTYLSSLCGRTAVQISVRGAARVSFPELAERLKSVGQVTFNEYMLRFHVDSYELSVFPDGRTIVKGTTDENVARSLYARYIGT
jgi:adenylyltransferase/sulfurtransferase